MKELWRVWAEALAYRSTASASAAKILDFPPFRGKNFQALLSETVHPIVCRD
jgi:hypothetical protein